MTDEIKGQTDGIKISPEVTGQTNEIRLQTIAMTTSLAETFPGSEIASEADLVLASEALGNITKRLKEWEARRVEIVTPANNFVRHINDLWKRMIGPVQLEDKRIRGMMANFRAAEAQRRQEEYNAALKESETIFPAGSPIPEVVAPIPEDVTRKVATTTGSVQFMTIWKWAIEDESQIPQEYFVLDTTKINKVVKAGIRNIPGLRIFSEQVPAVRSQ